MPRITVEGNTDQNGDLQRTEIYNPVGPFDLRVSLTAKLLEPANTTVEGEVDIDAADGRPSNERKRFVLYIISYLPAIAYTGTALAVRV